MIVIVVILAFIGVVLAADWMADAGFVNPGSEPRVRLQRISEPILRCINRLIGPELAKEGYARPIALGIVLLLLTIIS